MKLKIYFDDIEIGLPTDTTPKQISVNLDGMKETFALVVESTELLDKLKITELDG